MSIEENECLPRSAMEFHIILILEHVCMSVIGIF